MEFNDPQPLSQVGNDNRARKLFAGLRIDGIPGWTFTIWAQPDGRFVTSATRGGVTLDSKARPTALEALIEARDDARSFAADAQPTAAKAGGR